MNDRKGSTLRHASLKSTRALIAFFAIVLAVGVFAISSLPTEEKHALHTQGTLHPWLHLISFGLLALMLVSITRSVTTRLLFLAILLGFGYLTEARESRKDGWPIEQQDVRTDALGVLAGATAGFLFNRKRSYSQAS